MVLCLLLLLVAWCAAAATTAAPAAAGGDQRQQRLEERDCPAAERGSGADGCPAAAAAAAVGELASLGDGDVAVRTSTIAAAGRGAFASRAFAPGEQLGIYHCQAVPVGAEHDPSRSWHLNATHLCDASHFAERNPMQFVNSISTLKTCGGENARRTSVDGGRIAYIATRDIAKGEEILVDYGADYFRMHTPRYTDYECHTTPLCVASIRGNSTAVRQLLMEAATSPMESSLQRLLNGVGKHGWTALMEASAAGHPDVVRVLVEAKAALSVADREGRTALHMAAQLGHTAVVRELLLPGAFRLCVCPNQSINQSTNQTNQPNKQIE